MSRMNDLLTQAGLSSSESSAAEAAIRAKLEARRQLALALVELRRVADDKSVPSSQLKQAMAAYRKALRKYRERVATEDRSLEGKLSLASQVRCLALGILDNGLGMGGGTGARRGAGRAPGPAR
jgi:transcription initiation factor TFIIIB Brf1 subunit/transcription initiation factor TFIIB